MEAVEDHDGENVDPVLLKRSKAVASSSGLADLIKPSTMLITKSSSTGNIVSPHKPATPRARSLLQPKSPAARVNTGIVKPSPLSAPAGRSPTRGKRTGLLSSRRRTGGPYTRVDPPSFGLKACSGPAAPFSLDAALKGTIPSYTGRGTCSVAAPAPASRNLDATGLDESDSKSSWFFDIHEDSPEQEMTNLLQHSTCVLDISSDEESESRLQQEHAEGKENVPPADDVSQTSRPRALRQVAHADDMIIEKERSPLGEMNAKEYYAEGCDDGSVVIVPGDDEEEQLPVTSEARAVPRAHELAHGERAAPEPVVKDGAKSVDELMQKVAEPGPAAAVLAPIEGTGESFEVWESGSTKDEGEAVAAG